MIRQLRITAAALMLAVFVPTHARAQSPTEPPPADPRQPVDAGEAELRTTSPLQAADLENWLDGYVSASLDQGKIAGAVVSVVKDGRLMFSKGYGYADIDAKIPMDPARTLVRVGSTAKLFTWTAVMQQVELGHLDLERDVNSYLDFEVAERPGDAVTMLDLMNHSGGFEEGLREVLITDPEKFITTEEYLKRHPRPRIFPAGSVPAYSNYGTALAGYIVERVSGEAFSDYVDRHILTPLEMHHSTFRQPLPDRLRSLVSRGYMSSDEPPRAFELVTTAPAGSLSATANDMANFMIMHLQDGRFENAQILSPRTARRMHSPSLTRPPGFATMAHGFFSAMENGRRVIGHGGDTILFHSDLNLIPEEDVGFFVSFNSRGAEESVYGIRQRLFADFMDRYFPGPVGGEAPPTIAGAKADAQDLAGRYQSSRRIETAFLKAIYLLQQAEVTANDDGTISFSSEPDSKYEEISPGLWHEQQGDRALYITRTNGRLTIIESNNPTSVLEAVPAFQSAGLNSLILMTSAGTLLLVLLAWPIGWRYRQLHDRPLDLPRDQSVARLLVRIAAIGSLAYLAGWYFAFQPLLENRLDAYGPSLDPLLRMLQIAAIVPIAGTGAGLWNAWVVLRSNRHWSIKLGNLVLAAALTGILWIACIGRLVSFNLEY